MKLMKENVSRKFDSLGRISVPIAIRKRLNIADLSEVEFYTLEDDNGAQYICMTNHRSKNKYETAIDILAELGLTVPAELVRAAEDNE